MPDFIFPTVLRFHLVFQRFCCDTLGMSFIVFLISRCLACFESGSIFSFGFGKLSAMISSEIALIPLCVWGFPFLVFELVFQHWWDYTVAIGGCLLTLRTWVQSLGPKLWKERTDSCKLPSDLNICSVVCACSDTTDTHVHTQTTHTLIYHTHIEHTVMMERLSVPSVISSFSFHALIFNIFFCNIICITFLSSIHDIQESSSFDCVPTRVYISNHRIFLW